MSILFVGGEMGAFIPADSSVVETTASAKFDGSFSRSGIYTRLSAAYCEGTPSASATDGWVHFTMLMDSGTTITSPGKRFIWCNGAGTEVIRFYEEHSTVTSTQLRIDWWNGAAWVQAGSTIQVSSVDTLQTYDLHVVCNSASGSIKLYIAGTLRIDSGTIDLSSITAVKKVRFYGGQYLSTPAGSYVSQVIVADESTIGMRVFTVPVTGAGATSSWTGSYTEVDEAVYSDADFINSASVNQVSTFAAAAPTLTGYQIRAVAVTARARCGASGPQNLQLALRSAGTDYFSSSQLLDAGYGAFINIWETNPATAAAFTTGSIAALQPGVKSIT